MEINKKRDKNEYLCHQCFMMIIVLTYVLRVPDVINSVMRTKYLRLGVLTSQ